MGEPAPFTLKKWYFDCTSDAGDAVILYCTRLKWRALRANYASLLVSRGGSISTSNSLRCSSFPKTSQEETEITIRSLGINAHWQGPDEGITRTIYESDAGSIEWHCLHTRSTAEFVFADGTHLCGLGYGECLTLTIPPWKLPLKQLQWGRFVSSQHSIIWIDWKGSFENRIVLHNGCDVETQEINSRELRFGSGDSLNFESSQTLRDGKIGDTVLSSFPILRNILPNALFEINETKWCSKGRLTLGAKEISGWVIHELVRWSE